MITAADTNVFADMLTGEPADAQSARRALIRSAADGSLHISAVCYAEIARRFPVQVELDTMLHRFGCRVQVLDRQTAFLAGQLFDEYRRRGGDRTRILADFLVAADAMHNADRLLTRDTRFFGASFPSLHAVAPRDLILTPP